MLVLIFRSCVFLGVVGWYSTSLWKAIDDIFKDQFKRYLEDEYQRNPYMREHVRSKPDNNRPSCLGETDACLPVTNVEAVTSSKEDESVPVDSFEVDKQAVEKEEEEKEVVDYDERFLAFQNHDAAEVTDDDKREQLPRAIV